MQEILERQDNHIPDLEFRLEQSRKLAESQPLRTIRCPKCGFYMLEIGGYEHVAIQVKCRKCKFSDVIDTALFRTIRKRQKERLKHYCRKYKPQIR